MSWGRKDGFPGADGSTIAEVSENYRNASTMPIYGASGNTLEEGSIGVKFIPITTGVMVGNTLQVYAIKNPLTFIYNSTSPRDWYTDTANHNDALWGDRSDKSDFDPCPRGWRVPTDSELTFGDFSDITFLVSGSDTNVANGRTYLSMAWFPMAGYRNYGSGDLGYVGSRGHYWSASVNEFNAKLLYINMSNAYSSNNSRAWGLSIRCIQE